MLTTAYQAPDMNAFAERWLQTAKRECLQRMILFGPAHPQRALKEFVEHDHQERPHQAIGNRVLTGSAAEPQKSAKVVAAVRLGGPLRSYRHSA